MKYRTPNKDRFSSFSLVVCDDSGNRNAIANDIGNVANNTWRILKHSVGSWTDWNRKNLRVFLESLGTNTSGNVGVTVLEIEWIAIRLSNEVTAP